MRITLLIFLLLAISACDGKTASFLEVNEDDIVGQWYGIFPDEDETVLFVSTFTDGGQIRSRHTRCLSRDEQSSRPRQGTWSLAGDILTITYEFYDQDDFVMDEFTAQYRFTTFTRDYMKYVSLENGRKFWTERKWTDEKYDCRTTKAEIDQHRQMAIDDGRALPGNPLMTNKL